ncbi:hypothetical protein BDV28DRAFT_152849 [Aspergillus coremiiformis]|uniref:Amino acid permease/ SLC12A domain-containing protein n=1 Tax=Aspergillus coremiiformis TaxID=138285 RepID=A0A5N6YXM7_9EURO|nr:hypothetical protein BDV28DRAFT_152849 [Aspergillus coremiiformis]
MVNSSSDLEHAEGPVATSIHHGAHSSSWPADKLTKRMDASTHAPEKNPVNQSDESLNTGSNMLTKDGTHRYLKARHIQLIGIGGTIGTALYVQIGKSLLRGGPASLFLAFTIWLVSVSLFDVMYFCAFHRGFL